VRVEQGLRIRERHVLYKNGTVVGDADFQRHRAAGPPAPVFLLEGLTVFLQGLLPHVDDPGQGPGLWIKGPGAEFVGPAVILVVALAGDAALDMAHILDDAPLVARIRNRPDKTLVQRLDGIPVHIVDAVDFLHGDAQRPIIRAASHLLHPGLQQRPALHEVEAAVANSAQVLLGQPGGEKVGGDIVRQIVAQHVRPRALLMKVALQRQVLVGVYDGHFVRDIQQARIGFVIHGPFLRFCVLLLYSTGFRYARVQGRKKTCARMAIVIQLLGSQVYKGALLYGRFFLLGIVVTHPLRHVHGPL